MPFVVIWNWFHKYFFANHSIQNSNLYHRRLLQNTPNSPSHVSNHSLFRDLIKASLIWRHTDTMPQHSRNMHTVIQIGYDAMADNVLIWICAEDKQVHQFFISNHLTNKVCKENSRSNSNILSITHQELNLNAKFHRFKNLRF